MDFTGTSALVTGAGSGIGRATSQALASRGATVWATDFDLAGARKTVDMIAGQGGRARAVELDVRSEEQWLGVVGDEDPDEPFTVLINCAGKAITHDTYTMALEAFRDIISVNVEGTFLGMKHIVPRIAHAGGGAVVNVSSLAGLKGIARMTAYCGSKGAIRMMTKAVALECAAAGNGVRVNSVHPGVVDTPAWRAALADFGGAGAGERIDPEERARARVPIGVACTPEEVAHTICFLASHEARHITGAELPIDGGMTAG